MKLMIQPQPFHPTPDWKWGTSEGSREFDRRVDRSLTFREKLEWLEEAEDIVLSLRASRESRMENPPRRDVFDRIIPNPPPDPPE